MSLTLCSFTVASLSLWFAVLPVPIHCRSSFSMCLRSVGVSLGLFNCTRGFDFDRIRFEGVHSPGFSGSCLAVSNRSVSLMSLATGLTVLSPSPVIGVRAEELGSGAWVSCCLSSVSRVARSGCGMVLIFHSSCRFRHATLCFLPPELAHAVHPAVLPILSQKSLRVLVLVFQPILGLCRPSGIRTSA